MNTLDGLMKRLNDETNASYKIRKEGLCITMDINTFIQGKYLERLFPLIMSDEINMFITNENNTSQAIINILKNELETMRYMNDKLKNGINDKTPSSEIKKMASSTRTAIKASWLLGKQTDDVVTLKVDKNGMVNDNYLISIDDNIHSVSSENLLKFYYEVVPKTHKVKR